MLLRIPPMNDSSTHASLAARLMAFLLDVIPITLLTTAAFYYFAGFDQTWAANANRQPNDWKTRAEFLQQRNLIRDLAFLIYVLYASLMEGSSMNATIGKRIMGLEVRHKGSGALTYNRAFGRNTAKILSYIPFGLGFLWAVFTKRKLAWHDKISNTMVVRK